MTAIPQDEDDPWDDITFSDPWERLANAAPCLQWLDDDEDLDALTRYRMLVQSLEQQLRDQQAEAEQ